MLLFKSEILLNFFSAKEDKMSSISPSERSQKTDELRQQREDYEEREVEGTRRAQAEKKRIQERHAAEIENLKKKFDNQVDTIRNRYKDTISARDQENQEKIEKVRQMYLEQNRRKTEDSDSQKNELKRTFETEIDKNQRIKEQQQDSLTRNFKQSLQQRDEEFKDFQNRAQEKITSSIDERSKNLNLKHEKELNAVVEDRDERVSKLDGTLRETQSALSSRLKDQERAHRYELDKTNNNWKKTYSNQEQTHDVLLSNRNEMLQAERGSMQEKFRATMEDKLDQVDKSNELLKEQVMARQDSQVRAIGDELRKVKSERVVDQITDRRLRDLDRKALLEQQTARMSSIEKEKEQIFDVANSRARGQVVQVIDQNEKILQDTNRKNQMNQNMLTQRAREDRASLEFENKSQVGHVLDQTDKRVRRLVGDTTEDARNLQKFHEKTVNQMKNDYTEHLTSQRGAQMEMIQSIQLRSEERLRELENKSAKKLEQTVANYEGKIEKMKEDSQSEKSRIVEMYESRMSQREKAMKQEQEALALKYEGRISMADETRQKELDRLERRHKEQMADLSSRMKYLNKKG